MLRLAEQESQLSSDDDREKCSRSATFFLKGICRTLCRSSVLNSPLYEDWEQGVYVYMAMLVFHEKHHTLVGGAKYMTDHDCQIVE